MSSIQIPYTRDVVKFEKGVFTETPLTLLANLGVNEGSAIAKLSESFNESHIDPVTGFLVGIIDGDPQIHISEDNALLGILLYIAQYPNKILDLNNCIKLVLQEDFYTDYSVLVKHLVSLMEKLELKMTAQD